MMQGELDRAQPVSDMQWDWAGEAPMKEGKRMASRHCEDKATGLLGLKGKPGIWVFKNSPA